MIEAAMVYLLSSDNATGATGALVGTRVFPDEFPQKPEYPAIVYQVISGPRDYTQDGPDNLTEFRVQVDAYATTAAGANALRTAIRNDLSGYAGTVPISPAVRIQGVFVDNERDSAVPELEKAGPRVKRKTLDLMVWTEED